MVFLHEGLGSVSTWRDYPERLCGRAPIYRAGLFPLWLRSIDSTPGAVPAGLSLDRRSPRGLPAFLQTVGAGRRSPGCSGIATAHRSRSSMPPGFQTTSQVSSPWPHIFIEGYHDRQAHRARAQYLTNV